MAGAAAFARIGAEQNRQMVPMVVASALAHVLLFALFLFWPTAPAKGFGMNIIEADLVRGVPMSPMPKGEPDGKAAFVPPEPKEPQKESEPESGPKPEPQKNKDEVTLPVKNPTQMQREKLKDEATRKHEINSAVEKLLRDKTQKQMGDPEGVPGTQPYPGGGGMRDRMVALYLARLKEKVERNWVRPPGVPPGTDVKVGIRFQMDERGGVIDPRLTRTSGMTVADRSCMQALLKAAPFDRPAPTVLASLQKEGGIELIFELSR